MSDPLDTTAADGATCQAERCGEDATGVHVIDCKDVALCLDCLHSDVTECPGCERLIWQKDGHRVYSSPNLYCSACAKASLFDAGARQHRADERRDDDVTDFEQERR